MPAVWICFEPDTSRYSLSRHLTTDYGDVYKKPTGSCENDENCFCEQPSHLVTVTDNETSKLAGALCTVGCENASDCPQPPSGEAECFDALNFCGVKCSSDSECSEGGYCIGVCVHTVN
ncbi:hypothetical protein FOL47_007434 [Perkinsus chesapeaki]|uniref:Uncharacterized protein n=1 Tax=Perkinsus chesapeaki TaxID=330153 RepID=A0A7J6MVL4_PERCH|nr:hypothetical protein FOL47_007434 [Perkinsus chesapeaki]